MKKHRLGGHREDGQRDGGADGDRGRGGRRPLPRVAPWKKALVGISLVVMVAGLGLWGYAKMAAPEAEPAALRQVGGEPGGIAPQGLVPVGPGDSERGAAPAGEEGAPSELEVWSPAVFRLGFSFFAGFCIAYAMRAFLGMTFVVIGVGLLGLFGMQYAGLIDVNWGAMEGHYDRVAAWVGGQTGSFTRFVSGYLPSAASGAAGFAVGIRRR